MMWRFVSFVVLAQLASATHAQTTPLAQIYQGKIDKQAKALFSMTPGDFASKVQIKDDALEPVVTFSTVDGFQKKDGLLRMVNQDLFFRAFLAKKDRSVRFQVYASIVYMGKWQFFETVNYETGELPESKAVTPISREVLSCSGMGGCMYTEHVGFQVPEDLLRKIAEKYNPQVISVWRVRFKAKTGTDWDLMVSPAEIAGLLQAVDNFKSRIAN